jgi:hypothetical protein
MKKTIERFVVRHKKTKKFLDIVNMANNGVPIWKDNLNESRFFLERKKESDFKTLNNPYFNVKDIEVKPVIITFNIEE